MRPGTLPVALIVAFGKAAEIAVRDHAKRVKRCQQIKEQALATFAGLGGIVTGDQAKALPNTLNVSLPGLDSEAVMVALKDVVAISNGSACTSASYTPSHVLIAMDLSEDHIKGALRLSWSHLTPEVDWQRMGEKVKGLM